MATEVHTAPSHVVYSLAVPPTHSVGSPLKKERLAKVQYQYEKANLPVPDLRLLKTICKLNPASFSVQSDLTPKRVWTPHHTTGLPKGSPHCYFVARVGEALEVVIPLIRIQKQRNFYNHKSVWLADKILFGDQGSVNVQQVACTKVKDLFRDQTRVEHEINIRIRCNTYACFPHLLGFGHISGKTKVGPSGGQMTTPPKMMTVEEWCGVNLKELCESTPEFLANEEAIVKVFMDVMQALYIMHTRLGYVHCNIEMTNILISNDQKGACAKLAGLGSATPIGEKSSPKGNVRLGAPEIFDHHMADGEHLDYHPSVDIWCFAMVAYQLMTKWFPEKDFEKLFLNVKTPNFIKTQIALEIAEHNRFAAADPQIAEFAKASRWQRDIDSFIEELSTQTSSWPDPLRKWLEGLFKFAPELRPTSEQALAGLTALQTVAPINP